MGTIFVDPVDMEVHGGLDANGLKNGAIVCLPVQNIHPRGFFPTDPLDFSVPLLLYQLLLSSAIILLVSRLLKPYGQPLFVSQLLGAIIIGPSFLGLNSGFSDSAFPLRGFIMIDALASIGFMFYFFLIGVQIDPWIIKKIDKSAFFIGVSTFVLPMVLSTSFSFLLMPFVNEQEVAKSLPTVARVESVLSFPMIAYFLLELKIINSEFGRVALSSSVVGTLCGITAMVTSILLFESGDLRSKSFPVLSNIIVIAVILFLIRPAVMWMLSRNPDGEPLRQDCIILIFLAVLVTGFCSHLLGLKFQLGPFILGLTLPAGAPLGTTLVEKLDLTISWVLMPLFYAKIGLLIDIYAISLKHSIIILSIIFMSAFAKFIGTFLSSLRCQMPKREAISLGLVMTFQGVLELVLFAIMRYRRAIDKGTFSIMCILMALLTAIATPMIRYFYDPSRRYAVDGIRTVMHSIPSSQLRILVCIHDQENVPIAINFIEALKPNKQNPITVTILHLIELIGRTTPLLIPHMHTEETLSSEALASEPIVNAFKNLEQSSGGAISVFPFTSISPSETMHDDVCLTALEKRICLVMVPFHRRFHANGTVESTNMAAKITNQNLFDKPPCSIAILVDRGILKTWRSSFENCPSYRVAVLFLGGADDREALALGQRMAGCPNLTMTIIRLLNKNITDFDGERSLDNEMVNKFRSNMAGDYQVKYIEEEVMDGAGTVAVMRSMEDRYELVMVGRRHDRNLSPLVSGLTFWNEHKELGPIGEVLASSDFIGNTTILVVQQHTNVENESCKYRVGSLNDHNPIEEEVKPEDLLIQKLV